MINLSAVNDQPSEHIFRSPTDMIKSACEYRKMPKGKRHNQLSSRSLLHVVSIDVRHTHSTFFDKLGGAVVTMQVGGQSATCSTFLPCLHVLSTSFTYRPIPAPEPMMGLPLLTVA